MDFRLVIVVLLAYFIRPQDWLPGMAGTTIMKPLMAMTLLAMFSRRRGFSVQSLVKTPIDWAIIAYAVYIIVSADSGERPLSAVFILVAYYFVTSQALDTPKKLALYLQFWFISLIVVAAMAVMSEYGLDLTHAQELTNKVPEKPRLVLNTYLFNNANSLGHSVVLAVPLAYFVMIWRRSLLRMLFGVALIALAVLCVYMTRSKGAYIAGFMVLVVSQLIGRPRIFQFIMILLAATIGWAGLSQLPRMIELDRVRSDEAVQGRMLAWEQARIASKLSNNGEGWRQFKPKILFEEEEIFKATHSSYVLVGAELGPHGMFFYLAVLFACLRAVISARCRRIEDERSRRILFALLLGYMISGWLIDRSYHLEYFLMAGAISGLYRRLGVEAGAVSPEGETEEREYADDEEEVFELEEPKSLPTKMTGAGPSLAFESKEDKNLPPALPPGTIESLEDVDSSQMVAAAVEEELAKRRYWSRIGILDILFILAFTKIVFAIWDYLLDSFFSI